MYMYIPDQSLHYIFNTFPSPTTYLPTLSIQEPTDQDRGAKSNSKSSSSSSQKSTLAPSPTEGDLDSRNNSSSLKNQDLAGTGGKRLPYNISAAPAPTEGDLDGDDAQQGGKKGKKSLKELAKGNPSQLGDPVSLKAETSDTEPTDQDRGALGGRRGSKL